MQVGEDTLPDGSTREFLISGSRDKSVMLWDIIEKSDTDLEREWGVPKKILKGHSHFIEDLTLSQDSKYALTASWDGTIQAWSLPVLEGKVDVDAVAAWGTSLDDVLAGFR